MNKLELFIEVAEKVREEVQISDVVSEYLNLKRYGSSLKAVCPFHSATKIGSFSVSDKKGVFKCFSCGTAGDVIKFYSLKEGLDYWTSCLEIALNKGIINLDTYNELTKSKVTSKQKKKAEIEFIKKDRLKFEEERACKSMLDKVYRIFIKGNEFLGKNRLSEEHLKHLKEKRELDDYQIKNSLYFTFPTRHILKYFLEEVKKEGIPLETLKSVPGFFYDKDKEMYSFTTIKGGGIGIPMKNEDGLILGIQVRRDFVEEKEDGTKENKYIWFSSSFAQYKDNLDGGVGVGSPVDVVYPESISTKNNKIPCRTLFITEGKFKAEAIASTYNSIALSVQGVTSWRSTLEVVKNIRKKFERKYIFDKVIIAYDADLGNNLAVLDQAIKMGLTYVGYTESQVYKLSCAKTVSEVNELNEKKDCDIFYAMWSTDLGKGIDDFIINGHSKKIRKVSVERMYNLYMPYKELMYSLVANGVYADLKDIPKDILKEHFEDMVLSAIL